ncbi:MAG TPA: hypothetical protein VGO34_11295 [Alphaproteobacteria bacterium]
MNKMFLDPSRTGSLAELRSLVRAMERPGDAARPTGLKTGVVEIDNALPQASLALGALHEVGGPSSDPAACGFILSLLGRLCGAQAAS